jgi:Chaperone of endosialidase/Head domain of trimeric autotransporter adhesin
LQQQPPKTFFINKKTKKVTMQKKLTLLVALCYLTLFSATAQNNVGIGTTTPDASAVLDLTATTKGLLAPRMTQAQRNAITAPATGLLIYQTDNTPGFYAYNGTAWAAVGSPSQLEKITENGKTGYRILGRNAANYGDIGTEAMDLSFSSSASTTRGATGDYATAMGRLNTASGLHATAMGFFTAASGQSSTALGENTTASGNASTALGSGCIASGLNATAMGGNNIASGEAATAMGYSNTASGFASTASGFGVTAASQSEVAIGNYNTTYTPSGTTSFNTADRAFGVGIGTSTSARKDGLILYKDGTMFLNKLTAAPTTTTDRLYVLNNKLNYNGAEVGNPSQLEKITENSQTGYRLLGSNPANYGDIGTDALDLSFSDVASTVNGATGQNATAMGLNTIASGLNATAMGEVTTASEYGSTAMGVLTTASATTATAMGQSTTASGIASTAMGQNTNASGGYSTAMGYYAFATGTASTAMGSSTVASGSSSSAIGTGTTAPSFSEAAVGAYNTTYTPSSATAFNAADRAFGIGIGSSAAAKKDGFIVYKDGTMFLNKLTTAPTTTTDRLYVLNNKLNYNGAEVDSPSQLEKITENSKTGYRLLGRNAANYGNIGTDAVDLSFSNSASTTVGATGDYATAMGHSITASGNYATAMGFITTASGNYSTAMGTSTTASGINSLAMGASTASSGSVSTAMGSNTTASGSYSTVMGFGSTASGSSSTAMGDNVTASSYAEVAVGAYNTTYTVGTNGVTSLNTADRAFGVGIGSSASGLDGLIVYKTGNTFISNNGNTPANGTTSILTSTAGVAALQVRSSGVGMNLRVPNASTGINLSKVSAPSAGNVYISFGHMTGGTTTYTQIGSISASSGTAVAYNTSSDRRLKIDNGVYQKGLSTINNIKIHDYTWKETQGKDVGVFAQELYNVYPGAVSKGDDKVENDPTKIEQRWQVDYSKLVPVLVAATQELSAKNEQLEKENAALKAQMNSFTARLSQIENALHNNTDKNNNVEASTKK